MLFVALLARPVLVFLRFLSELGTRTESTDGPTSNSFIRMRNNKMIRHCWCRLKNVNIVVAIQKANESGCRFGQWRHGHRLVRDQWPVAVNRPLATTFHSLLKHSLIVRLLWQWFLATNEAA